MSNPVKELNTLIRLLYQTENSVHARLLADWRDKWCQEIHATYCVSKQLGTNIDIEKHVQECLHQQLARELYRVTTISRNEKSLPYEVIHTATLYVLGDIE